MRPLRSLIIMRATYLVRIRGEIVFNRISRSISLSRMVLNSPLVPSPALLISA